MCILCILDNILIESHLGGQDKLAVIGSEMKLVGFCGFPIVGLVKF